MNNKDFLNAVAARAGMTAKQAARLQSAFVGEIAERLDDETSLAVSGFGTLEVKKKKERVVVNPATGKRKLVPPKLVPAFKPAAALKEKFQ